MANVQGHFSATVVDGLGTEASTIAYFSVPDTVTLATLAASLTTWVLDVDACIDGAVTKNSIRITPAVTSGVKAATGATFAASRVEQTAVLNFSNATSPHRFGAALPSISDAAIGTDGKLDLTNAAVAALITLLTSALAGGNYTNNATQALVALIDAILSFRKRRKQLSRTSFEV